jgi:3-oxoacyl-[acyl-carrier protein] reductase
MSMIELKGRVAIVTGASKGIGAGIAAALGAAGASVVVNYMSDRAGAERVVDEIVRGDGRAIAVGADVTRAGDVARVFSEAKRRFGTPSVLVNSAGVFRFDALPDVTEQEFHREFDANVLGTLLMCREAARCFEPGGSIINVSSFVASNPGPGMAVYAATKAAVDAVTRVLALELGPSGIRVNAICPGFTRTEGSLSAGVFGTDAERQMVARTPLGRFGEPADVAPTALFLASSGAAWITGESIRVAGGLR